MNKNDEIQEHTALVFSIIFPGAGFLYKKKWVKGIVFGIVHMLAVSWFLYKGVEMIFCRLSGIARTTQDLTVLILLLFGIVFNWLLNIRAIKDYK